MCGIFAYIGDKQADKLLINGLRNLEYRGYDSAGMVCINNSGKFYIEKAIGKVSNLALKLENKTQDLKDFNIGIAHTRWATHGGVTLENCHPHNCNNNRFFVVHNGIIENFMEIKKELKNKKVSFYGDTDSETIAKLIDIEFEKNLEYTIKKISKKLNGAYALAVIDKENPNVLVGAKIGSPLVIGFGKNEFFLSSDPNALKESCKHFIPLEDSELVVIKNQTFNIFNFLGEKEEKDKINIEKKQEAKSLGNFKHHMLKEIHEIPETLISALAGRIDFLKKEITSKTLEDLNKQKIDKIEIIASGTSYNAGLIGKNWFEELSDLETNVYMSTEFKYKKNFINKKTLYIFISQSGETADSLECLKIVKNRGGTTFGIVNSVGSSIARLTDIGLYTHSGIEIGVASTKAFIGQLAVLLLISLSLGSSRNLDYLKLKEIIEEIEKIGPKLEKIIKQSENIKTTSKKYSKYKNMFFLGRNLLFPIAMEGSLKLKEITYNHSEAYSAGELKHGPLSLIDKNFPTVLINPKTKLKLKNISTLKEIQARKGIVIGIITSGDKTGKMFDDTIKIPEIIEELSPFLVATSLNLFAYYMALDLGREIDKPRNLAKSVTVE